MAAAGAAHSHQRRDCACYGEGIVRRPFADEEADARALYLVLAEIGGAELVGPARELPAGTFYRPAAAE